MQAKGTLYLFGIPFIMCSMPYAFKFDSTPQFKFCIWINLPDLPLEFGHPLELVRLLLVLVSLSKWIVELFEEILLMGLVSLFLSML